MNIFKVTRNNVADMLTRRFLLKEILQAFFDTPQIFEFNNIKVFYENKVHFSSSSAT